MQRRYFRRKSKRRRQAAPLGRIREASGSFGADAFCVVFHPSGSAKARLLIPYLERAGMNYVDLTGWRLKKLTRGPAGAPSGPLFPRTGSCAPG